MELTAVQLGRVEVGESHDWGFPKLGVPSKGGCRPCVGIKVLGIRVYLPNIFSILESILGFDYLGTQPIVVAVPARCVVRFAGSRLSQATAIDEICEIIHDQTLNPKISLGHRNEALLRHT